MKILRGFLTDEEIASFRTGKLKFFSVLLGRTFPIVACLWRGRPLLGIRHILTKEQIIELSIPGTASLVIELPQAYMSLACSSIRRDPEGKLNCVTFDMLLDKLENCQDDSGFQSFVLYEMFDLGRLVSKEQISPESISASVDYATLAEEVWKTRAATTSYQRQDDFIFTDDPAKIIAELRATRELDLQLPPIPGYWFIPTVERVCHTLVGKPAYQVDLEREEYARDCLIGKHQLLGALIQTVV